MYLQEVFLRRSFLCLCRKSSFVEAYVFTGNLPAWKLLMYLQEIFIHRSFLCICRKSSDSIIELWAHRFCEIALSKFSENFLRGIFVINKVANLQGLHCNFSENELFYGTIFYEQRRIILCKRQCLYLNANANANPKICKKPTVIKVFLFPHCYEAAIGRHCRLKMFQEFEKTTANCINLGKSKEKHLESASSSPPHVLLSILRRF